MVVFLQQQTQNDVHVNDDENDEKNQIENECKDENEFAFDLRAQQESARSLSCVRSMDQGCLLPARAAE